MEVGTAREVRTARVAMAKVAMVREVVVMADRAVGEERWVGRDGLDWEVAMGLKGEVALARGLALRVPSLRTE